MDRLLPHLIGTVGHHSSSVVVGGYVRGWGQKEHLTLVMVSKAFIEKGKSVYS